MRKCMCRHSQTQCLRFGSPGGKDYFPPPLVLLGFDKKKVAPCMDFSFQYIHLLTLSEMLNASPSKTYSNK